jgi:hypothetical protein
MAPFSLSQSPDDSHEFKTLVYAGDLGRMAGFAEACPTLETGGSLFGFFTHSGFPVVQVVTGPGPKSRQGYASFHQDQDYLHQTGAYLNRTHGLQHIGEWHSHHRIGLTSPSGGDSSTVWEALRSYDLPKFLLCIVNLPPKKAHVGAPVPCLLDLLPAWDSWSEPGPTTLACYLYTKPDCPYLSGAWVVLPGESPFCSVTEWACTQQYHLPEPRRSYGWEVTRTSLEAPIVKPPRPLRLSAGLWYATPEGLRALHQIDAELREWFQVCRLSRDQLERVSLTITIGPDEWRIEFPDDYPRAPAILRTPRAALPLNQCTTGQEIRQALVSYLNTESEREEPDGME